MRKLIATALSLMIATAAVAQKQPVRELPVKVLSATVEQFDPPMPSRRGPYKEALVLRLDANRAEWESLPPAIETFLYIGDHELRPIATQLEKDRVILTFHDPDWEALQGGERMVLTTEHGEPVFNPGKYADAPKYDPKMIEP